MEQDGSVMDVTFYVDESELEKLNKTENFFKDGYLVKQLNSKMPRQKMKIHKSKIRYLIRTNSHP